MNLPSPDPSEIFDDLEAEDDRLETLLGGFSETQWAAPSAASGWTVRDVIVHLTHTDEAVVRSIEGLTSPLREEMEAVTLDEAMDRAVRGENAPADQNLRAMAHRPPRRLACPAIGRSEQTVPLGDEPAETSRAGHDASR